jgi:hypothetical protein
MKLLVALVFTCAHAALADGVDRLPGIVGVFANGLDVTRGTFDPELLQRSRVLNYTWNNMDSVDLHGKKWLIPDEVTIGPIGTCNANDVRGWNSASSYDSFLKTTGSAWSAGFDQKVDLGIEADIPDSPLKVSASTTVENAINFGKSKGSSDYKSHQQEVQSQYTKFYSQNRLYKATILKPDLSDSSFAPSFKKAVIELSRTLSQALMTAAAARDAVNDFYDDWGTHIAGEATLGGELSVEAYASAGLNSEGFQQYNHESETSGIKFWFIDAQKSSASTTDTKGADGKSYKISRSALVVRGGDPACISGGEFCESVNNLSQYTPVVLAYAKLIPLYSIVSKIDGLQNASVVESHLRSTLVGMFGGQVCPHQGASICGFDHTKRSIDCEASQCICMDAAHIAPQTQQNATCYDIAGQASQCFSGFSLSGNFSFAPTPQPKMFDLPAHYELGLIQTQLMDPDSSCADSNSAASGSSCWTLDMSSSCAALVNLTVNNGTGSFSTTNLPYDALVTIAAGATTTHNVSIKSTAGKSTSLYLNSKKLTEVPPDTDLQYTFTSGQLTKAVVTLDDKEARLDFSAKLLPTPAPTPTPPAPTPTPEDCSCKLCVENILIHGHKCQTLRECVVDSGCKYHNDPCIAAIMDHGAGCQSLCPCEGTRYPAHDPKKCRDPYTCPRPGHLL